ncbi:hypothetical protein, partial [Streptomyces fuscigenes]|uniref:hypothetical protein n=1 Tax=Streptomyces fuscigenes TaxID=1528880 RepID=UPI001F34F665
MSGTARRPARETTAGDATPHAGSYAGSGTAPGGGTLPEGEVRLPRRVVALADDLSGAAEAA